MKGSSSNQAQASLRGFFEDAFDQLTQLDAGSYWEHIWHLMHLSQNQQHKPFLEVLYCEVCVKSSWKESLSKGLERRNQNYMVNLSRNDRENSQLNQNSVCLFHSSVQQDRKYDHRKSYWASYWPCKYKPPHLLDCPSILAQLYNPHINPSLLPGIVQETC